MSSFLDPSNLTPEQREAVEMALQEDPAGFLSGLLADVQRSSMVAASQIAFDQNRQNQEHIAQRNIRDAIKELREETHEDNRGIFDSALSAAEGLLQADPNVLTVDDAQDFSTAKNRIAILMNAAANSHELDGRTPAERSSWDRIANSGYKTYDQMMRGRSAADVIRDAGSDE